MKKNMLVLLFVAALGASATASGPCAAGSATTFTEKIDRERAFSGFLI